MQGSGPVLMENYLRKYDAPRPSTTGSRRPASRGRPSTAAADKMRRPGTADSIRSVGSRGSYGSNFSNASTASFLDRFATADGKASCSCSLCYKCAKIMAMSQRSTGAPTPSYHCYVCAAPCAGLLVPDATAATPRFETFDHPLNPHKTCSCCNSHHLTTDAKSHNRTKCPLNSDKENPNPTKRHKPAAVAPTPFANLGECVRDSNTTAYSGERVAVGVPIVASL